MKIIDFKLKQISNLVSQHKKTDFDTETVKSEGHLSCIAC